MTEVNYSFSDAELRAMSPFMPMAVQIRIKLNEKGFKFTDDNKVSAIINENPMPLGVLTRWHDYEARATNFKQVLP